MTANRFFEVADADGGLFIGARRNAENGEFYWRITPPWIMPSFTMVPPPRGGHPMHGHFWIPIDDHNCWTYSFDYHPVRALTASELQAMREGHGVHSANIPGMYRPLANRDNDYLMDRTAQRRGGETFSGVKGIAMQDASLQESMGPIVDRTKEQLVTTDAGIIKTRHKLRNAAIALRDHGTVPPGIEPAISEYGRSRRCAVREFVLRFLSRGVAGRARDAAGLGVVMGGPILLTSCAGGAARAEETRFRIDATVPVRDGIRVIALDAAAADVIHRLTLRHHSAIRLLSVPEFDRDVEEDLPLQAMDGTCSNLAAALAELTW